MMQTLPAYTEQILGGDSMKRAGMMIAVVLMMLPVLASAQQLGPADHVIAKVPFQFMLGNKLAPAGTYVVRPAATGTWDLNIQNPAAKLSVAVMTTPDESQVSREGYSLIFHKYGDHYFLTGIGLQGNQVEKLRESKAEAELRAKGSAPSTETIAALR
jgi:hypothetical protein